METEHFAPVCLDSCVEWFVQFMPEKCDKYFNFEVNANGAMNVCCHKDRNDAQPLTLEDIASLNIQPRIHEEYWEVSYTVPFTLIKKYIPEYEYRDEMTIRANFYKCGGLTEYVHHGVWKPILLGKNGFPQTGVFGGDCGWFEKLHNKKSDLIKPVKSAHIIK